MTVISKYIVHYFFKYFILVMVVVMSIFVATDYLTRIASFIKAGLPLIFGLKYILLKVPYMAAMLTPVFGLLSIMILFGLMNRNNEILALKGGGISVYYLVKPVALTGLLLSLVCFLVAETIVPVTAAKAAKIKLVDIKKKSLISTKNNNIWLKRDTEMIRIDHYDPRSRSVSGITIYQFSPEGFHLIKRTDAASGTYQASGWLLETIVESRYQSETGVFVSTKIPRSMYQIALSPEDFKSVVRQSSEMSIVALWQYIKEKHDEGYEAVASVVDFHAKMAFPFVCVIMLIAGAGIALSVSKTVSIPVVVARGIFFAFSFWVFYSICLSLGYGGILPPIVAAWSANFVFACLSGYILLNAE